MVSTAALPRGRAGGAGRIAQAAGVPGAHSNQPGGKRWRRGGVMVLALVPCVSVSVYVVMPAVLLLHLFATATAVELTSVWPTAPRPGLCVVMAQIRRDMQEATTHFEVK